MMLCSVLISNLKHALDVTLCTSSRNLKHAHDVMFCTFISNLKHALDVMLLPDYVPGFLLNALTTIPLFVS